MKLRPLQPRPHGGGGCGGQKGLAKMFKNRFAISHSHSLLGLIVWAAIFGVGVLQDGNAQGEPRALYTYSFGGIENMEVNDAVEMLGRLGYAGIAAEARGEAALDRLTQYCRWSERRGEEFEVVAAFMAHRFDRYGFSDAGHKAAIDRLARKGGTIWVWVRDTVQDGSITDARVENFITGIFEYAVSKGVKVILYPHYNTYYPTVEDAMPLVEKINHPSFGIAINLCHELMSDKGEELEETFERAKDRISAVIISGSLIELDRTSVRTMNESTIRSLDDSVYDLSPYMRLIKNSGFEGPIGFINFNVPGAPEDYLERTMTRWRELCLEVGLFEPVPSSFPFVLKISGTGGTLDFEWRSSAGKFYDLVSSPDLATAPATWAPYHDGVTTYENIPASETGTNTLSGVGLLGAERFFVLVEKDSPSP